MLSTLYCLRVFSTISHEGTSTYASDTQANATLNLCGIATVGIIVSHMGRTYIAHRRPMCMVSHVPPPPTCPFEYSPHNVQQCPPLPGLCPPWGTRTILLDACGYCLEALGRFSAPHRRCKERVISFSVLCPRNSIAFSSAPRREADSQPISQLVRQAFIQTISRASRQGRQKHTVWVFSVAEKFPGFKQLALMICEPSAVPCHEVVHNFLPSRCTIPHCH